MKLIKKEFGRFPFGIWIALFALLLIFLAWIMQAYSLLDWEGAVKLGLQNASFNGDAVEKTMANKERGEAFADLLWPLPLTIMAVVGLWRKELIGFIAAMMEYAICIYFPLFYVFQLWYSNFETALSAVIVWAIPSILGIIGLWANRNLFINH